MRNEKRAMALVFFWVAVAAFDGNALAGDNKWTTDGPRGSNINSIAISPAYVSDHTLYAASSANGISKSTDGGKSWSQVKKGLYDMRVQSVAVSPDYATDKTVFAGTASGVIYKTVNGGESWKQVIKGLEKDAEGHFHVVCAIALSPAYKADHTALAGTWGGGIYKTTDGGGTWAQVNSGLKKNTEGSYHVVYSIAVSPEYAADKTVYAGTFGMGLVKSEDGGKTWHEANNGMNFMQVQALAVSPDYGRDHTVYAGTFGKGVYKTSDGGANWVPANKGLNALAISAVAVSPGYAKDRTIYAVAWADGIYKSQDGGASWTGLNEGIITTGNAGRLNLYIYCLVLAPDFSKEKTLFAGTFWSVYSLTEK